MALSKRMKKILADFWAICNKYDEAYEKGDRKAAAQYGEELMNYCLKFQKELNFSDKYLLEGKRRFEFEKDEAQLEEKVLKEMITAQTRKEMLLQEYFDRILQDEADGTIKWN
ncbi:MAG TPA: hypothetical protein PKY59_26485 [Pyrinomonadaceae bacterium]|nr:hypothetical protein [Pyrinomonadaceae bacterium]